VQPKSITPRFIATYRPNLPLKTKLLFGLVNLFLQLIQIPGVDGYRAHLLAVAESQLPSAVAEFKSNVQNSLFYAIFDSQGFLSLFHLRPPLVKKFDGFLLYTPIGCSGNPA
jgi:hypothetical protein